MYRSHKNNYTVILASFFKFKEQIQYFVVVCFSFQTTEKNSIYYNVLDVTYYILKSIVIWLQSLNKKKSIFKCIFGFFLKFYKKNTNPISYVSPFNSL